MSEVQNGRGGLDASGSLVDTSAIESRPPRTAARLGVAAQVAVPGLKAAHAARIDDELPENLAQRVSDARRSGLSWELIGWSLGMDGETARNRWGSDQASR